MKEISAVITLRLAADDLKQSMWFYEGIESGLGHYFRNSLLADVESLMNTAGIHSVHFGYYRLLSQKFPFAIYYDIQNDEARIAAVLDLRRDPDWIRDQLEKR